MKKYDVVGLGACGVDLKLKVPKHPLPGTKVVATSVSVSGGGVTANNLVQCSKLGLSCAWLGALGNDHSAQYLQKQFKDHGVEIPKEFKLDLHPTQQFWAWSDSKNENSILGVLGASRALTKHIVRNEFSSFIQNCRHFHTEVAVIPLEAALEGVKIAQASGARVITDIDGDPFYLIEHEHIGTKLELTEIIAHTDVLKTTRQGAQALTGNTEVNKKMTDKILRMGPKVVVITDGDKGCVIADQNNFEKIKPIKVKVVDSVGAGDAFMGGLSYALLKGFPLKKVGEFANACGAFKCTKQGTRSSGSLKEINKLLCLDK